MATLKITQVRSRIGATAQQCKNLDALGLHKINQSATHTDSAIIKGMIERVKHLVKIEEVAEEKKATKKAAPKAAKVEAEPAAAEVKEETAEEKPAAKKPAAKKVTKTKKEE